MMGTISQETIDEAFALIEAAAVKGARCPMSKPYGPLHAAATVLLARAGKIRVEVSGRNWRQIFILAGPHKGKATAPNPTGGYVYKIVGRETVVKSRPRVARQEPSAPQLLARKTG
jgi:hypothetical protein